MSDAVAPFVIDLNADLGEGFGRWQLTDDDALLSTVTSANVACGFHAGDPSTMRRVCELAAERGVVIGAQVSYRDLAGFGRRAMDVPADELADEIAYQIGALDVFARAAGARVGYVKPHGALYNRCVHDEEQAAAVIQGVSTAGGALPVLGLTGSRLHEAARGAGLHRRRRGLRRPRLYRRGHPRAAPRGGRRDPRPGRGGQARPGHGPRRRRHLAGRPARRDRRPLAVPARRHPRRGARSPAASGPN